MLSFISIFRGKRRARDDRGRSQCGDQKDERKERSVIDEIPTECLKALNDISIGILTDLCNKIYRTGIRADDLMLSVFIKIPKKPKAL